jgi:hypothetical protein
MRYTVEANGDELAEIAQIAMPRLLPGINPLLAVRATAGGRTVNLSATRSVCASQAVNAGRMSKTEADKID